MEQYYLKITNGCNVIYREVDKDMYDSIPWVGFLCTAHKHYKGVHYLWLSDEQRRLLCI